MWFKKRVTYQDAADNDLAELFRNGDKEKVLAEIYQRFGHLMFGTCLNYLHHKEDAEDCVMEIFETLPKLLAKHEVNYLKSWLFSVTKNACLMRLRKKNNYTEELKENSEMNDDTFLEEKKLTELKLISLEEAITSLSDEQATAIRLFYYEKKSYQEVSETMGVSLNKVKSAIQNGKRAIKLKLENHVVFKSA